MFYFIGGEGTYRGLAWLVVAMMRGQEWVDDMVMVVIDESDVTIVLLSEAGSISLGLVNQSTLAPSGCAAPISTTFNQSMFCTVDV